jgi:hypothetical protein
MLCALSTCAEVVPSAPRPAQVEPGSGPASEPVAVVIRGKDFAIDVSVSYDDSNDSRVDTRFQATLGEAPLTDVSYVDARTLRATVPPGLTPGWYDLAVADPAGRVGTLAHAYEVLAGECTGECADGGVDASPDGGADALPDGGVDASPDGGVDASPDGGGCADLQPIAMPVSASEWTVSITATSINGGANVAVLAPGATFSLQVDYTIADCTCPTCLDQIEIGFVPGNGYAACSYDGQPGCATTTGRHTSTLTAPATAGRYAVAFDRGQDWSCQYQGHTAWWNGVPPSEHTIAAVCVQ